MFGIVYHNFKGKERIEEEEGKKKPIQQAEETRGDLTNLYLAIVSTCGWKMVILGNEPSLVFPKWVKVIFWLSAYSYSQQYKYILVDLLIKWAGHISTLLSQFQNKGELINERKFRNFPSTRYILLSSSIYIYVHYLAG